MGKGKGRGNEGISRCGRRPLGSTGKGEGDRDSRDMGMGSSVEAKIAEETAD